jgi:hypothetical protein
LPVKDPLTRVVRIPGEPGGDRRREATMAKKSKKDKKKGKKKGKK